MGSGGLANNQRKSPEQIAADQALAKAEAIKAETAAMLQQANSDKAKRQSLLDQNRADRDKDLRSGRVRGAAEFADGSLGRVDSQRAQEIKDIITRRQQEAQGFTPEEMNLMREQNLSSVQQDQAGQRRALLASQGAEGIRGNRAILQQAKLEAANSGTRAQLERDLALKNIDARRAGLTALEQSVGSARTDELARQQYNQSRAAAEKSARLTTELGYGALGSADRGGVNQFLIGEKQAAAAAGGGGGGKK